ncbi:MAG: DUF3102 domain-containing protein [Magnetococcales bacterium]|nr:DUF3102 domain-containing protein [Magnetococcales bacterium]
MANQPSSYDPIPPEDAAFIAAASERIRLRLKRTAQDIIEIGKDLIEVKNRLNHGQFGFWLENEFEMAERTARNFMTVAERFGSKSATVADFTPKVLYLLASPSTPEDVVDKAVGEAKAGNPVTSIEVQRWKDEIRSLKKQHREQQENLKSKVATLQVDLKNRTDRNAELTQELQEIRQEMTKANESGSAEDIEEWKHRAMAAEEKEQGILDRLKEVQQERTQLQKAVQELESREPLVVHVEQPVPHPSPEPFSQSFSNMINEIEAWKQRALQAEDESINLHHQLDDIKHNGPIVLSNRGAALRNLLDDMETGLNLSPGDFQPETLTGFRHRFLRMVTAIEEALRQINQPIPQE